MSAIENPATVGVLALRLEETLAGELPTADRVFGPCAPIGPTRRLRLRRQRQNARRPELLLELLRLAVDLAEVNLSELGQRAALVDQLRALARRLEELP